MKIMAQMAMVMNLDKCIGCHTCSVTCKQAWTNRTGTEYVWFNNVETRPGQGYPRTYENQERWQGGWTLNRRGRLALRTGSRLRRLFTIFSSPTMPSIDDYYEPWTYDYETLTNAPLQEHTPVARPKSLISGDDMKVSWSANWDDNLGGAPELTQADPVLAAIRDKVSDKVRLEFEKTFMFYLPRICEHCLNPSCAASCPSRGDLQARGGRHRARRPGPLPRLAAMRHRLPLQEGLLQPPHRQGREVHVLLPARRGRDPDRVLGDVRRPAALHRAGALRRRPGARGGVDEERHRPLRRAAGGVPRPARPGGDPGGRAGRDPPRLDRRGPTVAGLGADQAYEVALPLHPEYRTMPMVWYIPPLSPVVDVVRETGHDAEDAGNLFGAIDALRIPVEYLAELFTAGDTAPVHAVLRKLAAMRSYMRDINLGREPDESIPAAVGMDGETDLRHVPAARDRQVRRALRHPHRARRAGPRARGTGHRVQPGLRGRAGMGGWGPFGESSGGATPDRGGELPHAAAAADRGHDGGAPESGAGQPAQLGRQGRPEGLFPPSRPAERRRRPAEATTGRPEHRPAGPSASWPSSARSPGSCCGTPTTRSARPPDPAHRRRPPARPGRRLAGRVPRPPRAYPGRHPRRRLRRDVRPEPPPCAAPDLLHPRRHPQARGGPAAVQADLPPRLRARRLGRRRGAARPPVRGAGVRRHRRPAAGTRLLLEHRAGLELLRLALPTPAHRTRRRSRRSRPRCRRCRRRCARPCPPGGRGPARAKRSVSTRSSATRARAVREPRR